MRSLFFHDLTDDEDEQARRLADAEALADPRAHRHPPPAAEQWELQFADIFDQITASAAGAPINVVNPEVLTRQLPKG
jgi:hypothetical protein